MFLVRTTRRGMRRSNMYACIRIANLQAALEAEAMPAVAGPTATAAGPVARGEDIWAAYRVPDVEVAARGATLSVVGPNSPLAECFTKSYGRYTKVQVSFRPWFEPMVEDTPAFY